MLRGLAVLPACLTFAVRVRAARSRSSAPTARCLGSRHPCRRRRVPESQPSRRQCLQSAVVGLVLTWELYPAVRVSMDGRNISLFPDRMVVENFDFYLKDAATVDVDAPLRYDTDFVADSNRQPRAVAYRDRSALAAGVSRRRCGAVRSARTPTTRRVRPSAVVLRRRCCSSETVTTIALSSPTAVWSASSTVRVRPGRHQPYAASRSRFCAGAWRRLAAKRLTSDYLASRGAATCRDATDTRTRRARRRTDSVGARAKCVIDQVLAQGLHGREHKWLEVFLPVVLFRRLRDTRGGSLVEAALITPLLLLLTFGIIDFASMFYVYLALENGVSQATRYGVTGNLKDDPMNPGTPLNRADSIKLAMRQATPTLDHSRQRVHVQPSAGRRRRVGRPASAGRARSRRSRSTTRGRS